MSVRAKLSVTSVENYGQSKKVNMSTVYETDEQKNADPENVRFTKASPSGQFWITIDNPAASEQFEPGQQWYADFSLAKAAGA